VSRWRCGRPGPTSTQVGAGPVLVPEDSTAGRAAAGLRRLSLEPSYALAADDLCRAPLAPDPSEIIPSPVDLTAARRG
jgi:hypothetical protein